MYIEIDLDNVIIVTCEIELAWNIIKQLEQLLHCIYIGKIALLYLSHVFQAINVFPIFLKARISKTI